MPTYEFLCRRCNAIDDVVRSAATRDLPYPCPQCHGETERHYSPPQVITHGEQIRYLHPAFGRIMSDREAKIEAKRQGLIEVGNEDMAKHIAPPKPLDYEADDYFE